MPHESKPIHNDQVVEDEDTASGPPAELCAHYFLEPLSWMGPELELGRQAGRLACPGCKANVGDYAWQGKRCSCGEWIAPGISITRSRVDQVYRREGATSSAAHWNMAAAGIAPERY